MGCSRSFISSGDSGDLITGMLSLKISTLFSATNTEMPNSDNTMGFAQAPLFWSFS
jgi:hypothetical protein